MSNLHTLDTEEKRTDGKVRFLALPVRTPLDVLSAPAQLPEVPAGTSGSAGGSREVAKPLTKTTLLLTIAHSEPLPDMLSAIVEQRCYDYLSARGIRADVVVSAEVTEVV